VSVFASDDRSAAVTASDSDGCTRIVITGALDEYVAARLHETCDRAGDGRLRRLELDLSAVTAASPEGVAAITGCLAMGRRLPDGVGVTVANDAGRRALLDSMAEF
jgi:anti-anti-sigma regulatory factor